MTRLTRRAPQDRETAQAMGWLGRLLRLDFTVFDELRTDRSATPTALGIVFVSSFLAGVGTVIWATQHDDFVDFDTTQVVIKSLLMGSILQTAVWFTWVYITYMIVARVYGAEVLFSEMVRTMGFAFAPVALSVFVAIAPLAIPFGLMAFGATLLLTTAAVEHASHVDQKQAMLATLAGFAVFLIFMGALSNVMEESTIGGLAPGILFFSLDL